MLIKARMGMSADGFVATPEGVPTLALMPGFIPAASHGYPEFIEGVTPSSWAAIRSCPRSARLTGPGLAWRSTC